MMPAIRPSPLSRMSAVAAILFIAAFLLVNALTFVEGTRRLAIIDDVNRLDIPELTAIIDDDLWQTDEIISREDRNAGQVEFMGHLAGLREKFSQLEASCTPLADGKELTSHFAEIYASLEAARQLYTRSFANEKTRQDAFEPVMDDINFHFNRIALWALARHHKIVADALDKLHERENILRVSGVAFVTLGCLSIIFLVIDLYRRDELLMNARQAERMKNSFFSMMSHEIRTPINGVLGMLTLLMESAMSPQQSQMAKMAKTSAEGLLHIVNDVLDYSKIEAGKLDLEYSDFSLRELVENAVVLMAPLADNKGLSLSYSIAADLPDAIHADPTRVRQILLNFISNAVKFTEKGGVQIQVFHDYTEQDGGAIRFNVTDSGIGISPEERALLFREFSQVEGSLNRRFTGTGLGLAICARLASRMKGAIGVISDKGKGSTFWFSVPLKEAQNPLELKKPEEALVSCRPTSILIAEDNVTNQMIAAAFLRSAGHSVDIAENGARAVHMVQQKNYDLVFMDISMPVMDGLVATKNIRGLGGRFRQIPILAMTAHAMRGDREECLAAGMNGYIPKPATREALLRAVQHWASLPVDPILSCNEDVNVPGRNPDGSRVMRGLETPCGKSEVFPYDIAEIEEHALQQLYSDLGAGAFREYEKIFRADIDKLGRSMSIAAEKQEWTTVQLNAHSIKSSVLNFGLVRLSCFAEKIERQCEQEGKAESELVALFPQAWQAAQATLDEKLGPLLAPPL